MFGAGVREARGAGSGAPPPAEGSVTPRIPRPSAVGGGGREREDNASNSLVLVW